ncbi:MAG: fimbrillin family protein [Mediterranea sp.]|jgi:hypothetical protein|nr:fimbrillin family protein [Mediterranea sp.]
MRQRILLSGVIATTLALLSSCNQSVWNEADSSPGTPEFITLKALTGKTDMLQTRVAETTTATLRDFRIYGWMVADDRETVEDKVIFDNEVVTKSETGGWSYEGLRTWPDRYGDTNDGYQYNDQDEHNTYTTTFRAISPANSPNLGNTVDGNVLPALSDWDDDGWNYDTKVYYRVPTNLDEQEDLLIAIADKHHPGEQVELVFNHLLAKVEFYARSKQSGIDFKIKKVGLKNLYSTGQFSISLMNDRHWLRSTTTGKWTYEDDDNYKHVMPFYPVLNASEDGYITDDYIKELSSPVNIAYNADPNHYTSIASGDGGIFVLPQPTQLGSSSNGDDGKFYVMVTYEIQSENGAVEETCYFPAKQICHYQEQTYGIAFEAGRKYRFKITLEDKGFISLNVDCVGDMDDANSNFHDIYLPDQDNGLWPIGSSPSEALGIALGAKRNGITEMVYGLAPQTVTIPFYLKGNGIDWRTKYEQLMSAPPMGEDEFQQAMEQFLQDIGLDPKIELPSLPQTQELLFDMRTKGLKAMADRVKVDLLSLIQCIDMGALTGVAEIAKPEWAKEIKDNPEFVDKYGTKIRRKTTWIQPDGGAGFLESFHKISYPASYQDILFGSTNLHKYLKVQAGYDITPYDNNYDSNDPEDIRGTTSGIITSFYVPEGGVLYLLGDYFFLFRPTKTPEYGLYKVSDPSTPIDLQDGPEKIYITFTPFIEYHVNI